MQSCFNSKLMTVIQKYTVGYFRMCAQRKHSKAIDLDFVLSEFQLSPAPRLHLLSSYHFLLINKSLCAIHHAPTWMDNNQMSPANAPASPSKLVFLGGFCRTCSGFTLGRWRTRLMNSSTWERCLCKLLLSPVSSEATSDLGLVCSTPHCCLHNSTWCLHSPHKQCLSSA